ncbi:hypothetical protein [Haladaptatus sp. DFWS20]|uniref:hypothetical protein n=1 Tax=Haladaptatus sp. DFWS20 TaxID=3403467 RepID=UPI003EB95B09
MLVEFTTNPTNHLAGVTRLLHRRISARNSRHRDESPVVHLGSAVGVDSFYAVHCGGFIA